MANEQDFNVTDRSAKEMRSRMKRGLKLTLLLAALSPLPARAQDATNATGTGLQSSSLGMAPGLPQADALPGGTAPSFGQPASGPQDWRFDFHGYFTAPLRIGINHREHPTADQSKLVL